VCRVYCGWHQLAARDNDISAAVVVLLVRPDEAFATAVEQNACPFKPLATDYQVVAAGIAKQEPGLNPTSIND
jgi:hypothetical protein